MSDAYLVKNKLSLTKGENAITDGARQFDDLPRFYSFPYFADST
jgi:hypothetical protein